MDERIREAAGTRAIVPEMGWPLILALTVLTAATTVAAIPMMRGQVVPAWISGLLLVVVLVGAFSLPAMNRRARAVRHAPAWGRKVSAVLIAVAVTVPLLVLFPAAMDPQRWGWAMGVTAALQGVLLLVAAGLTVRLKSVTR